MWLQIGCPRCPATTTVPAAQAGSAVVCAGCGSTYLVPSPTPIAPQTSVVPASASAATVAAESRLPQLEVLQPPSRQPKPAKTWEHEKQPRPTIPKETAAVESPTAVLPPSMKAALKEATSAAPYSPPAPSRPVPSMPAPSETSPKPEAADVYPSATSAAAAGIASLPPQSDREDLTSVEERMQKARRRAIAMMAMVAFGMLAMVVFAAIVINLSRPG